MASDDSRKFSIVVYGGKQYRACGVCEVCTMPEYAWSDCGQPVLVNDDGELPKNSETDPLVNGSI